MCVCVCVCVCEFVSLCGVCNVCVCKGFVMCRCFGNMYVGGPKKTRYFMSD